jgi:hypothetical protein
MRYGGQITEVDAEDFDYEIDEAILTDERVAIDWKEEGEHFHLLAQSRDGGRTYQGHFGAPRPDPDNEVRLTRLDTFDNVPRLFAHWVVHSDGNEFRSLINFEPAPDPE